jgi:CheY-like chemotaxis protein
LKILIVEDEALLALELESLIEDCGHEVAGWAPSVSDALDIIEEEAEIDLVFLDIQLQDGGSGFDVADYLKRNSRIAFVFLTANPRRIPKDFAGACGVISKPYSITGLLDCIGYLEEGIRRPPPSLALPTSFRLSPEFATAWSPV